MVSSVAVIPARGGSKRVPGKNTREFCGVPAIVRAIRTVQQSGVFDSVIVSTDSPETAQLALAHGAIVPELRPNTLADDQTPTRPVVVHAIETWMDSSVNLVACVYAVTPLLSSHLLREAVEIALTCDGYVFPVERSRHPVQRAIELDANGRSFSRERDHFFSRSQDLAPVYFDVGQFYVARRDTWLEREEFHDRGRTIEVPIGSAIDVDTEQDWRDAERLFESR